MRPSNTDLLNSQLLSTLDFMVAWLRSPLSLAPHLKLSTLTGQPHFYAYVNESWQLISKTRFDQLLASGHFYQHQAASSTHELIYNRQTAKRS